MVAGAAVVYTAAAVELAVEPAAAVEPPPAAVEPAAAAEEPPAAVVALEGAVPGSGGITVKNPKLKSPLTGDSGAGGLPLLTARAGT